jgi:hypothetical protein
VARLARIDNPADTPSSIGKQDQLTLCRRSRCVCLSIHHPVRQNPGWSELFTIMQRGHTGSSADGQYEKRVARPVAVCKHGRRDDDQKGPWRVDRQRQCVPPSHAGFGPA